MLSRILFASFCVAIGLAWSFSVAADTLLVAQQAVVGHVCHIHLEAGQIGDPLGATVDFGDGGVQHHYSDADLASEASSSVVTFQHVYQRLGLFTVWANISGAASWKTSFRDVLVLAPSGAVRLRLFETDSVVPVLHQVMALAAVSAGNDHVTFDWDFGDGTGDLWTTILSSNGTHSLASHKYGIAGSYPVRVVVSGQAFATPVAVELSAYLQVVEPIRDVYLRPLLGRLAASLKRCHRGSYCTDEIVFEARTDQGSHVYFVFDFGDGTRAKVAAKLDLIMNVPYGRAAHAYRQVGSYSVCVTVSNPLGSRRQCLAQPFPVQTPPEGLRLSEAHYIAQVGKVIWLKVALTAGTNVSFDWQIAGERRINAGPEIAQVFAATGNSKIVVTAYNNVTDLAYQKPERLSVTADLSVRNALEGVQLEIASHVPTSVHDWVVSTKDSVKFLAHLRPPPGGGEVYLWSWGDQSGRKRRTLTNRMTQTFHEHGRYSLMVTVANYVSNVSSSPVGFRVVQQLEQLQRLRHPSSILRGRSVPFEALFWYGSDLTYTWDFGDGTATQATSEQPMFHAFERLGEFVVMVKLSNVLGSGKLNATVFVLDQVCHQPLVTLLGIRDDLTVYRGEDVRAEAEAETQCAASTRVSYLWDVGGPGVTFRSHRRLLLMPTDKMAAGSYVVHLRVRMNGTIVYTDVWATLRLADPPLRAQIAGPSIRSVGRQEDVVLIGSTNKNGAGHSGSNIVPSFQWKCVSSTNPKSDCFPNSELTWNQTELRFAASRLDAQLTQFLFILRVRLGPENATASQVLQLTVAPKVLHVNLLCASCHDRVFVTKHDRVAISVDCADCATATNFEWQLWLVLDGNQNLPISQHDCVQPDGSTFYLIANSSDVGQNTTENPSAFNSESFEDDVSTMMGPLAPKNRKRQRKPATNLPTEVSSRTSQTFGESSTLKKDSGHHWTQDIHDRILQDVNITEGFAGEAGSAAGRNLATALVKSSRTMKGQEARPAGRTLPSRLGYRTSKRRRGKLDNFATKQWISMHLLEEDTVTGLNGNKLVIKPGVLKPGRTYVTILDVQGSANADLRGRAMQEIRMFAGPSHGRCLLHPSIGYEYLTAFKLDCLEWVGMDSHHPLFYELSYTLRDAEDTGILVHYGLDNNFKFVLPAGVQENDHNVYLNVAVHQKFGGLTDVCALSVKVRPLSQHLNISMEELIDEELNKPTSSLLLALDKDDLSQVLNRIQVVASVLNSRNDMENGNFSAERNGEAINPYKVRQVLLSWISALNISTEEEALQMLAAVDSLMEATEQVDFSLLETVSGVVYLSSTFFAPQDQRFTFGLSYYRTSLRVLNSLFRSLASLSSNNSVSSSILFSLFDSYKVALRQTIAYRLGYQVLGEPPLRFSCKYFTLEAKCWAPSSVPWSYSSEHINVLFGTLKNGSSDRICLMLITFNDYFASDQENATKSNFPVVTTNFMHHNELQLVSPVDVNIPSSHFEKNAAIFGTLYQEFMEVYTFVVSENITNQDLVVRVKFEEDFQSLFPILLLLSSLDLPCIDDCIMRRKFSPGSTDLSVTIAGDAFSIKFLRNGPNYHLGIVHADYGSIDLKRLSKRPKISVNFTLHVELIKCVQWDVNETAWRSDGCSVRFSDTSPGRDVIGCRCNKLTDYSVQVHSLPCVHRKIETSNFFQKSLNPVVPAVLVVVVLVFAALMYGSTQISRGREHICGQIWLKDNWRNDRHAYLVTVQTGYQADAGTSSSVFLVLHGENGASEPRELYEEARRVIFNRGSRNSFIVTTPSNLGSIWKVQIWHSCSGRRPSWFLDHIIVQDLSTGSHYYFECEKWLAFEEIDGSVEKELLISEKPVKFFQVYWTNFWQFYTKLNIWGSLYQRPPCDHFLHFERVLLCLVNSSANLALAALWCHWWDLMFQTHFQLHSLPSLEFLKIGTVISFFGFLLQVIPALALQRTELQSCKKSISIALSAKDSTKTAENCLDSANYIFPNESDEPFVFWKPVQEWAHKQWNEDVPDVGVMLENLEKEVFPPRCSPASDLSGASSSGYGDCASSSNNGWRWNKRPYSSSPSSLKSSSCAFLHHVLPIWFRYIAYFFCCAGTLGSFVITLWIAARFSMTLCVIWLLLTVTSMLMTSCLLFPVLVAAFALPFSLTFNSKMLDNECICGSKCCDDSQGGISSCCGSKTSYGATADMEIKKRLRLLRYARPPKESELQEVKEQIILSRTISSFVRNTLATIFIFVILLVAVFGSTDTASHPMNRLLLKQWQKSLTQINNETQWWGLLATSLIPFLYSNIQEDQVGADGQKEFWYLGQTSSILVGKPHLYRSVNKQIQADVTQSLSFNDDQILPYQNATSVYLPRIRNEVDKVLEDLKMHWFRENGTSLGVRFSIYSIPSTFLSEIRLIVYFPLAGNLRTSMEIDSVRLQEPSWLTNTMLAISKVILLLLLICNFRYFLECLLLRSDSLLSKTVALNLKALFALVLFIYVVCVFYLSFLTSILANVLEESRFLVNVDISSVVTWNKVCNGALGFLLILHVGKCLHHFHDSSTNLRIGGYRDSASKSTLAIMGCLFLLLVTYSCLTALWKLNEKVFSAQTTVSSYLISLITRNLKIGCTFQKEPILASIYFGSLLVLIISTITCGVKVVLNSWSPNYMNPNITFGIIDICMTLKSSIVNCLTHNPESQKNTLPEVIPLEIVHAELESQVEEMLFRVDQLCRYEGVKFNDIGCSSSVNYNLHTSSEEEEDALPYARSDEIEDARLPLSAEKLPWPDVFFTKDCESETLSSSDLSSDLVDDQDVQKPRGEATWSVFHQTSSFSWPVEAVATTSGVSKEQIGIRSSRNSQKSKALVDCKESSTSTDQSPSPSRPRKAHQTKNLSKKSSRKARGSETGDCDDFIEILDDCSRYNKGRKRAETIASGVSARALQAGPRKGRIHRTKTQGKELFRKRKQFATDADPHEIGGIPSLASNLESAKTCIEVVLNAVPSQYQKSSGSEESLR